MSVPIRVNIPAGVVPGIEKLLALSDEEFEAFTTAVQESEPSISSTVLARTIASKLGWTRSDVRSLINFLGGVFGVLTTAELGTPDVVSAVTRSVKSNNTASSLLADPAEQEKFEQRVTTVLETCEVLNVSIKSGLLVSEYERLYIRAHLVTDLRPVFGSDASKTPAGALLMHVLRLTYEEDDEPHDLFITLDSDALQDLRRVLDRASVKISSLNDLLDSANIKLLGE